MHFCLAMVGVFDFGKLPKIRIEWPEATSARHTRITGHDDAGGDMEAQIRKESSDDSEIDQEEAPLLDSS